MPNILFVFVQIIIGVYSKNVSYFRDNHIHCNQCPSEGESEIKPYHSLLHILTLSEKYIPTKCLEYNLSIRIV